MHMRPFHEDDAPAVAALWEYWFRSKTRAPASDLVDYVRRLYVEHPSRDDEIPPLVAEDDDGRILGFLGVMVTPVILDGRRERLAGVFPSVVDPDAPTTVATFLLRRFLKGPQALTLSDGGHVRFEGIWERLGGRIDPLRSLRWVKVLRPAALGAERLGEGGARAALRGALGPLARGADWLARRGADERFASRASTLTAEPLTPSGTIEAVRELRGDARMRPDYDEAHLEWLFAEMGRIRSHGTLHGRLLRTARGDLAGWYVYYLNPGGVSRVFALDAREERTGEVLDHLFSHADAAGAAAVIGRLEPRLRAPLVAREAFVHAGGSLLMVHSKDASLMDDALLGRLSFSRLEGENWYWWGLISDPPNLKRN